MACVWVQAGGGCFLTVGLCYFCNLGLWITMFLALEVVGVVA
jgi:hypothetical protein